MDYADIDAPYPIIFSKYEEWKDDSVKPIGIMKKVVLKATEQQIHDITYDLYKQDINYYRVYDLGVTQVPSGSFTCVCTEPIEEEISNKLFGHLKLF